jgi:hypothetical protein
MTFNKIFGPKLFYFIFASNKRTSTGDGFRENSDLVTRVPQILKTTALYSAYISLFMEGETK